MSVFIPEIMSGVRRNDVLEESLNKVTCGELENKRRQSHEWECIRDVIAAPREIKVQAHF